MRAFIAVDLSIPVVNNLVLLQEDIDEPIDLCLGVVRWTKPQNIHLTLKFLGEVDDALVYRARDVLRVICETQPIFEFQTKGTGAFPSLERPRILYAGTAVGSDDLAALRERIEQGLEELGVDRDTRPFKAHVTLGRIKTPRIPVDAAEFLTPFTDTVFGTTQVKDLVLYESELRRTGPVYKIVERIPFRA